MSALEQVPRLADRSLVAGRPRDGRADDAAGLWIHAQEISADAPHGSSIEFGDPNLEHDLLRAHHAKQVDDVGDGATVGPLAGSAGLGRGAVGGHRVHLAVGAGLALDHDSRPARSAGLPRDHKSRRTAASGRLPSGPSLASEGFHELSSLRSRDGPGLLDEDRSEVVFDHHDDPGDLERVAGFAFNHKVVADLAQLDARVGEGRTELGMDHDQVGQHANLEVVGFTPRGRDRQVGHADSPANDPDLPGVDHDEIEDRRVADGDQRLVPSGDDVLLQGEDPRLVNDHCDRLVVAM